MYNIKNANYNRTHTMHNYALIMTKLAHNKTLKDDTQQAYTINRTINTQNSTHND